MSTPTQTFRNATQRLEDLAATSPFLHGNAIAERIDDAVATAKTSLTERTLATRGQKIARGMGWFSIGLGLVEILAGAPLAKSIGLEKRTGTLRAFGLREIGAGIRVLKGNTRKAMWSRVLGDVMDIGLLASAFANPSPMWSFRSGNVRTQKRIGTTIALGAVLGATALDVIGAIELERDMLGGF